jgi:hypothetical protein
VIWRSTGAAEAFNRVVARKKKTGFLTLVPTLDKSKTKLVFGGCELGSCFGGRCFTLVCFVWLDKMNTGRAELLYYKLLY